ncbi:MAG: hypothetical protein A2V66_03200 [Ignavibacteria bacterium RBG_13_36_8]|nr:MAG: hypothetical protein A2V66_03200 [Ignavibacteria bacterium RBG_13_36_8]
MYKYFFSMFFLLLITNFIYCQTDCPGGIADSLTESTYKWYWDEDLDGAMFSRTAGLIDLDLSTKIQIVRTAITTALDKYTSQTYGAIYFSEGDENDTDALKIEFTPMDSDEWGSAPGGQFKIQINSTKTWTDYTSLVEPTYYWPDIQTIMIHEMGHIFGLTHASPTSTSVMYYNNGNVRRNLTDCDKSTISEFYNPEYSLTIQNNFNDGSDYVNIYDSENYKLQKSAPYNHVKRESTWPWDMEAENQNCTESGKTYYMQFQNWSGYGFGSPQNEKQDVPMVDDGTFTAIFNETYNVTFTNKYGSSGTGGLISVKGSQVSSPSSTEEVVQYSSINAAAISQTINYVYFTFQSWTKDGGQTIPPSEMTSGSPPFIPTDHTTYECNLQGKPVNTYRHLTFNDDEIGEDIELTWDAHPDTDVEGYIIWRKVKEN